MASIIDRGQAQSLIREFRIQNQSAGQYSLKTADGHYLNGFYLDRESLEEILKDPTVTGIHVDFAKHPDFAGKPVNIPTLLFSGSELNTRAGAIAPFKSTGMVYHSMPCPPWCNLPVVTLQNIDTIAISY